MIDIAVFKNIWMDHSTTQTSSQSESNLISTSAEGSVMENKMA